MKFGRTIICSILLVILFLTELFVVKSTNYSTLGAAAMGTMLMFVLDVLNDTEDEEM